MDNIDSGVSNMCDGGEPVAEGDTLFSGQIANPIECNAEGKAVEDNSPAVWTGFELQGDATDTDCDNWRDNTSGPKGTHGNFEATDETWMSDDSKSCTEEARVYCIELAP